MTEDHLDAQETRRYWQAVHSDEHLLHEEIDPDLLAVVIHPGAPPWYNRWVAHVQRAAFEAAVAAAGSLEGKRVLDVGCGSGRWSRRLEELGAQVVAIDISEEAIGANRRRTPEVDFRQMDVVELDLAPGSFDLATSITVLQHLTYEEQREAVARLAKALRPGGRLLIMENTKDVGGHMFARPLQGWLDLVRGEGFEPSCVQGYDYQPLLRLVRTVLGRIPSNLLRGDPGMLAPPGKAYERARTPLESLLYNLVYRPAVGLSYLVEPACRRCLPTAWGRHCAITFRRL